MLARLAARTEHGDGWVEAAESDYISRRETTIPSIDALNQDA